MFVASRCSPGTPACAQAENGMDRVYPQPCPQHRPILLAMNRDSRLAICYSRLDVRRRRTPPRAAPDRDDVPPVGRDAWPTKLTLGNSWHSIDAGNAGPRKNWPSARMSARVRLAISRAAESADHTG